MLTVRARLWCRWYVVERSRDVRHQLCWVMGLASNHEPVDLALSACIASLGHNWDVEVANERRTQIISMNEASRSVIVRDHVGHKFRGVQFTRKGIGSGSEWQKRVGHGFGDVCSFQYLAQGAKGLHDGRLSFLLTG